MLYIKDTRKARFIVEGMKGTIKLTETQRNNTFEEYQNLIVRIGGFSARFAELDSVTQNEILLRTTYDAVG